MSPVADSGEVGACERGAGECKGHEADHCEDTHVKWARPRGQLVVTHYVELTRDYSDAWARGAAPMC